MRSFCLQLKLLKLFIFLTGNRGSGKHSSISEQSLKNIFRSNLTLVLNLYYSKINVSKWIWTSDSNCTELRFKPLHHDFLILAHFYLTHFERHVKIFRSWAFCSWTKNRRISYIFFNSFSICFVALFLAPTDLNVSNLNIGPNIFIVFIPSFQNRIFWLL